MAKIKSNTAAPAATLEIESTFAEQAKVKGMDAYAKMRAAVLSEDGKDIIMTTAKGFGLGVGVGLGAAFIHKALSW